MIRTLFFVAFLLFGQDLYSQIHWPNAYFNEKDRATSTAYYIASDTSANYEQFLVFCNQIGFDAAAMLKKMERKDEASSWHELRRDLRYFSEQTPKFIESFTSLLRVDKSYEHRVQGVRVDFTKDLESYRIEFKGDGKRKIKRVIVTEGQVSWSPNGPIKSNGQIKRRARSNFIETVTVISNEHSVLTLEWTNGDRKSFYLPAFPAEKPWIKSYKSNTTRMIELQRIDLNWQVFGAKNITIDNGLGEFPSKWQVGVSPHMDTDYILTATNEYGTSSDTISIKVDRQKLVKAEVSFVSHSEKDAKSKGFEVLVDIFDINQRKVCSFRGLDQEEISGINSYDGPYSLSILEDTYSLDLVRGEIRVQLKKGEKTPDDTWKFSPLFILTFSDGTVRELYGYGWKLLDGTSRTLEVMKF